VAWLTCIHCGNYIKWRDIAPGTEVLSKEEMINVLMGV